MAAEKARWGSMGHLTGDRIAKFTQAVKDWGGAGRSYPSCCWGVQIDRSRCDLWYEKYGQILDSSQRWRPYESHWQARLLLRYLHGRVALQ